MRRVLSREQAAGADPAKAPTCSIRTIDVLIMRLRPEND
jgi:hypothetical protein